jgi:GT2 family glycosyltransferase
MRKLGTWWGVGRVMDDVCVIIVSHNGKRWLDGCLNSLFAHAGDLALDVVVVDNGTDGSATYVEEWFPRARTIRCVNRGFGAANNVALATAQARYVLFLNPDTEFVDGSLENLVHSLDRRPEVGLAGVRQLGGADRLAPTMRRFPSTLNMLAEALAIERLPILRRFLGERVLDPARYDRETACDWTSGSFMLASREALDGRGFDERFFLFSEETDLCRRLADEGWRIVHSPLVTIRHFESERSATPRMEAQAAYSRLQYARKHFRNVAPYRWAMILRYALRSRREAARAALATILKERPPIVAPAAPSPQETIVKAPGAAFSSTRSRSPM